MAKQPAVSAGLVTQHVELPVVRKEKSVVVSLSTWHALMDRLRKCGDSSPAYSNAAWAFIGIAASSVVSAITFTASADFVKPNDNGGTAANLSAIIGLGLALLLTVAPLIGAILSFAYAKRHKADRALLRQVVIEDMQGIEERLHGCIAENSIAPGNDSDKAASAQATRP